MQNFSLNNLETELAFAVPQSVSEAAHYFAAVTSSRFPDALAVVLSVLAGTLGPTAQVVTPRGSQYSSTLNVFACAASGAGCQHAISGLRAPLDNAVNQLLDRRFALGEKGLAQHFNRAAGDLRNSEMALRDFKPTSGWFDRDINEEPNLQDAVVTAGKAYADAAFMRRPWIFSDTIQHLDAVATDGFDQGLFIQIPDAEATCTSLAKADEARIISAGFSSAGFFLDSKTPMRPSISNLWMARAFPQSLMEIPAMQSFIVADLGGCEIEDYNGDLEKWQDMVTMHFECRLQGFRYSKGLSAAAAALYKERQNAWRKEICKAPVGLIGALALVPAQALKIGLLLSVANMWDGDEEATVMDERWVLAGFTYAEYFARRLMSRASAVPPSPVEVDLSPLVNRLLLNGPMTRRQIVRTYHDLTVQELDAWITEGIGRGILIFDGKHVSLPDGPVSVSARQPTVEPKPAYA